MVYVTFTEEMVELIKELKGSKLLSYECEDFTDQLSETAYKDGESAYGNMSFI